MSFIMPETICPYCDAPLNTASNALAYMGMEKPAPEDLTICIYCTQLLKFDKDLHLCKLTPEEEKEVLGIPLIAQSQRAMRRIDRSKLTRGKK